MKFLKVMFASIGVFILLMIAGLTYVFWGESFAYPLDESYGKIRLLKTGKVDTLIYYTTQYEVGDTVIVFRSGTHYADTNDLTNDTGKSQKAVVLEK